MPYKAVAFLWPGPAPFCTSARHLGCVNKEHWSEWKTPPPSPHPSTTLPYPESPNCTHPRLPRIWKPTWRSGSSVDLPKHIRRNKNSLANVEWRRTLYCFALRSQVFQNRIVWRRAVYRLVSCSWHQTRSDDVGWLWLRPSRLTWSASSME